MPTPHTSYRIRGPYKRLLILLAQYHGGISATALLHSMIAAKGRATTKSGGGTDEIRALVEEIGEGNGAANGAANGATNENAGGE